MDAFRKAIIHVHVAAVSDVHRFPANHHDFSPRVIASMYASMSAMLRAISHDFSVSRICGFQCRRLASNQRPPRLQLGALANWATTALLGIVIIWWHVDNNPCCHNWLSRPWRESNPPRLLRQRSILPQDITAMNELIMSSLTAIKSDSIRSYIIWNTCIWLQSVAFNHMMVFNVRSTRPFWFMYLAPRTNRGSETAGWNLTTTTRRPATVDVLVKWLEHLSFSVWWSCAANCAIRAIFNDNIC